MKTYRNRLAVREWLSWKPISFACDAPTYARFQRLGGFGHNLALSIVLILSGCASIPTTHTERYIDRADRYMEAAKEPQFNATLRNAGGEIETFGKVSGSAAGPVNKTELSRAVRFQHHDVTFQIWQPLAGGGGLEPPAFFDSGAAWYEESLRLVELTLQEMLAPMSELKRQRPIINAVVAPAGSGIWVRGQLNQQGPDGETWLMIGHSVREADRSSSMALWTRILRRLGEHTMRLQQLFKLPAQSGELRRIDYAAATELYGLCGAGRFMLEAEGEGGINAAPPPDYAELFPDLLDGVFNPNVTALQEINLPVSGMVIARALIFYAFSGGDGTVDIADPNEIDPMLDFCVRLAREVPHFVEGETGLGGTMH